VLNILKLENVITKVDGSNIILPNSVSVDNGNVIITDSGNNRVCIIGVDNVEYSIGTGFGIGKYKFKEPVYSTTCDSFTFVCDWHNHRIAVYDNIEFHSQVGLFGLLNGSKTKNLLRLLRTFKNNGSFDVSHFSGQNINNEVSLFQSIKNIFEASSYYLLNPLILIQNIQKRLFISKPNGAVIVGNCLYFTQKDNHCVTGYDLKQRKIIKQLDNSHADVNFGRLGQISYYDNKFYVCDETNNKVWILDSNLSLVKYISLTDYNVFSISFNDKYIATCGVNTYSIFDHEFNKVFESTDEGEYHGVCLTAEKLYVVNRLKHQIEQYKIIVEENEI
jgi:hypothetical protein